MFSNKVAAEAKRLYLQLYGEAAIGDPDVVLPEYRYLSLIVAKGVPEYVLPLYTLLPTRVASIVPDV
jgi:hypothetical protein